MNGNNILGFKYSALATNILKSMNPKTMEMLEGAFHIATPEEVDEAMQLAEEAFHEYKLVSSENKARFLEAIADEILNLGDHLINRACQESGLPAGRITGERGRTVGQLRLFAKLLREGSWVDAVIDVGKPNSTPAKGDIRRMMVPLGPVVVFTASNFPLAFSTAGGDTASALAAGCPVVVKAHESHLGTNGLVAIAIKTAAEKTGMPDGVFSSLNGTGPELGQALVKHPFAKAIAFTGSGRAGRAIFDTAAARPEPIPVFAEMGSINPIFLLPDTLAKKTGEIAKEYAASITLGVGQFCTNPGLFVGVKGQHLAAFKKHLAEEMDAIPAATMLSKNVCRNYQKGKMELLEQAGVSLEWSANQPEHALEARAAIASVSAAEFLENPALQEEVFGPFTLVVEVEHKAELYAVAASLQGQLTATIMAEKEELMAYQELVHVIREKAGRLILNNAPTGVEVGYAMQHGGPYPASTNSQTTSVGTAAIQRFARPVAFQNWLEELLPDALQNGNPLNIWRLVNGVRTNGKIG